MSDLEPGTLYQDLATGAICVVDDITNNSVTLHMTDSPYRELEMPAALFLTGYALANSE
jgi:hypothetical protein